MNELELYVHIPFCRQKCRYCDFVSFAGCEHLIDRYVDALCREIRERSEQYHNRHIVSVYIGGGTPSILNCGQISKLAECLTSSFAVTGTAEKRRGLFLQKKIRPSVEFSIEANPESIDPDKLRIWRKLGVNRLSIGLQSADDLDLKMLGRIHDLQRFSEAFEDARNAGFDNINTDLMQAIPGQSLSAWKRVLAVVGTFHPEHLSAYSLMIEEGTPFYQMKQEGTLNLPDEDTEREIYYYTRDFLEKAGYHRYEISNYAMPGFECRHNTGYWKRTDYLGLGLHASSMVDCVRWKNTDDLMKYISVMEASEMAGQGSAIDCRYSRIMEEREELSHTEQMEEFMILGLRMTEGVSRKEFFECFGQDLDYTFEGVIPRLRSLGLISSDEDRLHLTDRGFDVSNTVLSEFLLPK